MIPIIIILIMEAIYRMIELVTIPTLVAKGALPLEKVINTPL